MSNPNEQEFKCPYCEYVAPNQGGLNLHIHKRHSREIEQEKAEKDSRKHKKSQCEHKFRLLDPSSPLERKIIQNTDCKEVCVLCTEVR